MSGQPSTSRFTGFVTDGIKRVTGGPKIDTTGTGIDVLNLAFFSFIGVTGTTFDFTSDVYGTGVYASNEVVGTGSGMTTGGVALTTNTINTSASPGCVAIEIAALTLGPSATLANFDTVLLYDTTSTKKYGICVWNLGSSPLSLASGNQITFTFGSSPQSQLNTAFYMT